MNTIKNIIFDLGGVLLDIEFKKTIDAFKKLGIDNFEEMFSKFTADELFKKLETGHIAETDFYKTLRNRAEKNITNEQIKDAWNSLILDFRIESLAYLERLAPRYQLYLLSNTNSIHLQYFKKLFTLQTAKRSFDDYFKKAWYSNEIGLRKPGTQIFEFVLHQENLLPGESLFIDDTFANIETAQKLGFVTHHLLPAENIELLEIISV